MSTFYRCSNNSVVALMTEAAYFDWLRIIELKGKLRAAAEDFLKTKYLVFTFVPDPKPPEVGDDERLRYDREFTRAALATGTYTDKEELLEGHEVKEGGFHVPFSNGTEYEEIWYMTSVSEARSVFGKPAWIPKILR